MITFDEQNTIVEIDYEEVTFWGIFIYQKGEDPTVIVGRTPLIFPSYQKLLEFADSKSGKKDFESWKLNGFTVVSRPFKAYRRSSR